MGSVSEEDVLEVMRKSHVPLTAVEIAKETGKVKQPTARKVNPILYALEKRGEVKNFITDGNPKPKWTLVNVTNPDFNHLQISSQVCGNTDSPEQRTQPPISQTEEFIELKTPIRKLSCGLNESASLLMGCAETHRDWKQFAFEVGFQGEDISRLEHASDPPFKMMSNWWAKQEATVGKFIEILYKMERADVIDVLRTAFKGKMSLNLNNHIDELLHEIEGTQDNNETGATVGPSEQTET